MFALTIELIRPISTVSLIPLVILIPGLGYVTEISIIAFGTLWPVFIISRAAIHDVEPRLFEVAQALGLPRMQRVLMIVIHSIAPRRFLAFRLAVGLALIIAVTVEITTNPLGARQFDDTRPECPKPRPGARFTSLDRLSRLGSSQPRAAHIFHSMIGRSVEQRRLVDRKCGLSRSDHVGMARTC